LIVSGARRVQGPGPRVQKASTILVWLIWFWFMG
jgi:hypothetical protein